MHEINLRASEYYLNRELSLLQFNYRVFAQAQDKAIPLLERLKFLFICSANLDEFFEIRVAGLKEKQALELQKADTDGLTPTEALTQISHSAHELVEKIYVLFNQELLPALAKQKIYFVPHHNWSKKLKGWIKYYFRQEVQPVLSPIGLDLAHPFPRLVNKSLNFIVSLEGKDAFGRNSGLAIVHAPRALPRAIKIPKEYAQKGDSFVLLTSIIQAHADDLFPGMTVTGCYQFRLTRNSDLFVREDEVEDLASALKTKLFSRRYGNVVRLEIATNCPENITNFLLQKHNLQHEDLYYCDGPVNLSRYMAALELINRPDLQYPALTPAFPKKLHHDTDYFSILQKRDIVLHHPFETFNTVVDFIHQATLDPNVLAIKQTLYRTRPESSMVQALIEAARAGKEVTAVIELRARFDEESNIALANLFQEAGALVVYGVVGFKTHAKMTLVVRREGKKLGRYAHLGTGNYHERTTKQYTDIGLLTYQREITDDVQKVFQQLTGMGKTLKLKKLIHAPFTLDKTLINLIEQETTLAKAKKPAYIIMKVNGLTDEKIICALYRASQAGVKIDLIVRGACCLKPGITDVSKNIKVRSIVGRFLEHARIYYFHNNGDSKIYCASADLMERNLYHRVELCFPIEDKKLAKRVKEEGLLPYLQDNTDSWQLQDDGQYQKNHPGRRAAISAQQLLLEKLTHKK